MKKGDGIKITVAVVVLAAAALLIAYNFGLFTSNSPPVTPTETSGPVHGQPRTPGGAPH
jgi:hypothetical protein